MSYYTGNQNSGQQPQQWHQHSQTSSYSATTTAYTQANGTGQQAGQRQPIGPVLNAAMGNILSDLKKNMDPEFFKTTTGMLSGLEVVSVWCFVFGLRCLSCFLELSFMLCSYGGHTMVFSY